MAIRSWCRSTANSWSTILNRTLLHVWSKPHPDQSDALGFRSKMLGRVPKKSFFLQRIASWSIDAKPTEHWLHN